MIRTTSTAVLFVALTIGAARAEPVPPELLGAWAADPASPWTPESDADLRVTINSDGTLITINDERRVEATYEILDDHQMEIVIDEYTVPARFFVTTNALIIIAEGEAREYKRATRSND